MDAEEDEIDDDLDRPADVHDRPRDRIIVVEEVGQQSLLVSGVPE